MYDSQKMQANTFRNDHPGCESKPTRQPELVRELEELDAAIGRLEKSFTELGAKLQPVTRPMNTASGNELLRHEKPMTIIAQRIYDVTHHLCDLRQRVDEQIELTEL